MRIDERLMWIVSLLALIVIFVVGSMGLDTHIETKKLQDQNYWLREIITSDSNLIVEYRHDLYVHENAALKPVCADNSKGEYFYYYDLIYGATVIGHTFASNLDFPRDSLFYVINHLRDDDRDFFMAQWFRESRLKMVSRRDGHGYSHGVGQWNDPALLDLGFTKEEAMTWIHTAEIANAYFDKYLKNYDPSIWKARYTGISAVWK